MEKEYIKCEFCKSELIENNFYKIITEKRNERTGEYEPYTVCKKCVMRDYFLNQTSVFQHDVNYICKKYNLYYDINIVDRIVNSDNKEYKIGHYIKEISSLRQYINKKYKDSVFEKDDDIIIEEKSDIDFINDDIEKIKEHIQVSMKNHDFNSHNKWMNCLRDAIELREKLIMKEAIEIDKRNSDIIGNALRSISERIICHDILSKVNEMAGIIASDDNVYDILKGISYNWSHLSKETKDDLARLVAGKKDKNYFIVLLDSFSK